MSKLNREAYNKYLFVFGHYTVGHQNISIKTLSDMMTDKGVPPTDILNFLSDNVRCPALILSIVL